MSKGWFISFEGPDGSGKSTQISLLAEKMKLAGFPVYQTREPGGTLIGEKIRSLILDPANHEMAAVTEALLYAAARAQHAEEVIKPLLSAGRIVLSDRYMDSSLAYQGVGRRLGDAVRQVNEIAVGGLQPNRTFLLALDPAVGLNRIDRAHDRLEAEAIDYHRMVYQGFLDLAQQHPDRIRVIRADQPSDQIHAEIIADLIDLDPGFEKLAEAIR